MAHRPPAVCVLGMHRSGTSVVARSLNLLGADVGRPEDLLPADPVDSPTGYWEQVPIMKLNNDILAALGGSSWAPPEPAPGWHLAPALRPLRDRAERILSEQFRAGRRWVLKDPRFSLTLPFWREVVPDLSVVVCLRNPGEVADSLVARDPGGPLSREDWAALWMRYTESALRETEGLRPTSIFYEDWFTDPRGQIRRLGPHTGRSPDHIPRSAARRIQSFVDRSLRRKQSTASSVAADPGIPEDAAELYLRLRRSRFAERLEYADGYDRAPRRMRTRPLGVRRPRYTIVSRALWPFHVGGGIARSVHAQASLLRRDATTTIVSTSLHSARYEQLAAQGDDRLPAGTRIVLVDEPTEAETASAESFWHVWSDRVRDGLLDIHGRRGPDLLEFSDYVGEGAATLAAKRSGEPALRNTLACVRLRGAHELIRRLNGMADDDRVRSIDSLERKSLQLADVRLSPAPELLLDYRRFYSDIDLRPAVDLPPAFAPAPAGPPAPPPPRDGPLRVLYLGRLQRAKGVENLVRAAAALPGDGFRLELVGLDTPTGPEGTSMRAHLEALARGDGRIEFVDQVSHEETRDRIDRSHLVVVPSLWETFANVAREALQHNRPVLATPVGGTPRIVEPGTGGWLTRDPGPDAIAESLGRLVERPGQVHDLIARELPRRSLARSANDATTLAGYRRLLRHAARG